MVFVEASRVAYSVRQGLRVRTQGWSVLETLVTLGKGHPITHLRAQDPKLTLPTATAAAPRQREQASWRAGSAGEAFWGLTCRLRYEA